MRILAIILAAAIAVVAVAGAALLLHRQSSPRSIAAPAATPTPVHYPVTAVDVGDPGVRFAGVYDPHGAFVGQPGIVVEHVFRPWRLDDPTEILEDVHRIRLAGRLPMITVEPWSLNVSGMTQETLFADIVSGKYDSSIEALCAALAQEAPQPIWLRWAHEMELTGVFPWSRGNPAAFVPALRHLVMVCRYMSRVANNIQFIWSPAGNKELAAYWPGADYVDMIGVTVLGYMWDRTSPLSFEGIFSEKYGRVAGYGKPVVIAEFGVVGSPAYQDNWLRAAFSAFPKYPLLRGVVYFNDALPGRPDIDFRVSPSQFPIPL